MIRGWGEPEGERTRAYLVRHGEVDAQQRTMLYGSLNVDLSERGRDQSRQTARLLAGVPELAGVVSSDLSRAHYLAAETAAATGLAHDVREGLRERSFGAWQGRPIREIVEQHEDEYRAYMQRRWEIRVAPGAENFDDVSARVIPVVREMVARHAGRSFALVSHSGPLRSILAWAMHLPGSGLFRFELGYCSISIVDFYSSGEAVVRSLNDRTHLDAPIPEGFLG